MKGSGPWIAGAVLILLVCIAAGCTSFTTTKTSDFDQTKGSSGSPGAGSTGTTPAETTGNSSAGWPISMQSPYDVAIDRSGNIYVTQHLDTGAPHNSVWKFRPDGSLITTWGPHGDEPGQLLTPNGIAVSPDGSVYVADSQNSRIVKYTSSGGYITEWGSEGTGPGQFKDPENIAAAPDGSVYVEDKDNARIEQFSSSGTFMAAWDGKWAGSGYDGHDKGFDWENGGGGGIAVGPEGSVYVADTYNLRVVKYSHSGAFITQWGTGADSANMGNDVFYCPYGIAVSPEGSVVYIDDIYGAVNKIDAFASSGGPIIKQLVSQDPHQDESSWGIAAGPDGSVYAADQENNQIQKFSSTASRP